MAEGSMNFSRAPGFTGSRIDRADNLRLDEARIATFLGDLKARLLRLEVLDPVLAEDGRLAWGAMTELAEGVTPLFLGLDGGRDRKSTRLNSKSLMRISYAVFCLKKKTVKRTQ